MITIIHSHILLFRKLIYILRVASFLIFINTIYCLITKVLFEAIDYII